MRLVRTREVCRLTALSRVSIWRRERRGDFPRRIRLGSNSVAWDLREVEAWITEQLARRSEITASFGESKQ